VVVLKILQIPAMDGYRSLGAWQLASQLSERVLEVTDSLTARRTWTVIDQLRRAALSVDLNIVEGYALGTPALYRHHLRIAYGSAAEVERLLQICLKREYLEAHECEKLLKLANGTLRALYGLLRSRNLACRREPR
jgi:four helix bundle protein